MKLKLNDEFICTKKGDSLHVVSVFPDHNEVYKFQGKVAEILDLCFKEKSVLLLSELEKRLGLVISQDEWEQVEKFLISKRIFIKE